MNNKCLSLLILFLLPALLCQCDREENSVIRPYPRLVLQDNFTQSEEGITFNIEILSKGNSDITEEGIIWSQNTYPTINSFKITSKEFNNVGKFKVVAKHDFRKGETYIVSAYLRDKTYLVYSDVVKFECSNNSPAPVINDFIPRKAKWGDTIKIQGENFSTLSSKIKVRFGNVESQIYSSTDSTIIVKVPGNGALDSVDLKVSVYDSTGVSARKFKYIKPQILDFSPKHGTFNDTITIYGKDFPTYLDNYRVEINGTVAQVLKCSDSGVKVLVPLKLNSPESEVKVTISGITQIFPDRFLLNAPLISDFSPTRTNLTNNVINIYGENFNPDRSLDSVMLGDYCAEVLSGSPTEVKIIIPYNLEEGNYKISLTAGGITCTGSNEVSFTSPWTKKSDFQGVGRWLAVGLSIKGKGYVGLGNPTGSYYDSYLNDFWEYDPESDNWTQKSNFIEGRLYPVYFTINDTGYIGAGYRWITLPSDFWQYNPASDTWVKKGSQASYNVTPVCFSAQGCGYYCDDINKYLWKYDPALDAWKKQSALPASRTWATGFAIGNKLYFCTGYYEGKFYNELWEYDLSTNKWTTRAPLPDCKRFGSIGFTLNGKGYVGLGQSVIAITGPLLKDIWEYDPNSNSWRHVTDFPGGNRISAICFEINGKEYIGTGKNDQNQVTNDFWEFDPLKE